jgi:hypothetical protein
MVQLHTGGAQLPISRIRFTFDVFEVGFVIRGGSRTRFGEPESKFAQI